MEHWWMILWSDLEDGPGRIEKQINFRRERMTRRPSWIPKDVGVVEDGGS